MMFVLGLVLGAAVGVWLGGMFAREKRKRQIDAALKEGRVTIARNDGAAVAADDFNHLLDDEFRDA